MPPSKSARRKQQTRLAFTPLTSSSLASKSYHEQIRDRAAAVTLESSPSSAKRRKTRNTIAEEDSDLEIFSLDGVAEKDTVIPTPAATLERGSNEEVEEDSDDQPIRSTQQRNTKLLSRSRPKQQRLDFSSTRDPDSFDSPIKLPSSARTRLSKAGMFSSRARRQVVDVSSDDEFDAAISDASEDLPSPRKLLAKSKKKEKKGEKEKRAVKEDGAEKRTTRSSRKPQEEEAAEDESGEITVKRGRRRQAQEESEDDEEDELPTTLGTQKRKRRRPSRDSFISDSPPQAADSDDVVIVEKPSKKKRRRNDSEIEDEEDEDEAPKTPRRRRLKQPRQMSQREKEDLAEDLDFLGPSSEAEFPARNQRSTQSAKKTAKQQALERLKRSRSGQLLQVEEEEQDNDDQEIEQGEQEDFDELYDNDDDVPQITSSRQMFREDEGDADFLVEGEEEEGNLGIPEDIPLEYTRYASMKPKELFKYAIEWMVQKKINPAFQMHDAIYDLTFKKLDDEVSGLAGSKFTSSAWTPEFTLALQSRPDIAYSAIDRHAAEHFMRDKCDACNRSGHPATYEVQFQGKPYHRDTLEEVANEADEDEDENDDDSGSSEDDNNTQDADDQPAYNAQGREIVAANTIFYVGKFCMSNANTAHALQHWRYHLYEIVVDWLKTQRYLTDDQIIKRDNWSTKKRRKYANRIVDRMESDGDVKKFWRSFRERIDEARDPKQGRYRLESP